MLILKTKSIAVKNSNVILIVTALTVLNTIAQLTVMKMTYSIVGNVIKKVDIVTNTKIQDKLAQIKCSNI